MRARAYAKINLTLEILGKRADGYHELASIMQTIDLADDLELELDDELILDSNVSELSTADNLILRAARVLGRGGHFRLTKRTPVAAGLGGGSSDAAAALRLLNAQYGLGLSHEQLSEAAAEVGSDVPFFLTGGTALVEGRGEKVTPLADLPPNWLVLVNPGVPLSTAAVFGELTAAEHGGGRVTHGYTTYIQSVNSGVQTAQPLPPLVNELEAAAGRLEPAIAQARIRLEEAGATHILLSGSGPTLFALLSSELQARDIASKTGGLVAHFVGRDESLRLEE